MKECILLAERLKELRKNRNLKQSDVYEKIGCSQSAYSGYECGKNFPPTEILISLAKEFNISIDWLCGLDTREKITVTYEDIIRNAFKAPNPLTYLSQILEGTNERLNSFINKVTGMIELRKNKSIDSETFEFWFEKEVKNYSQYLFYPYEEPVDPFL